MNDMSALCFCFWMTDFGDFYWKWGLCISSTFYDMVYLLATEICIAIIISQCKPIKKNKSSRVKKNRNANIKHETESKALTFPIHFFKLFTYASSTWHAASLKICNIAAFPPLWPQAFCSRVWTWFFSWATLWEYKNLSIFFIRATINLIKEIPVEQSTAV